ncbi:putative leader peptide [Streptosporangium sp. NPDC051022]|uniref:putative leader peptide n=1 Tax=Streptosporangium sp. NPDC051022 TaxID=3155752 RepID=UPI00341C3B30
MWSSSAARRSEPSRVTASMYSSCSIRIVAGASFRTAEYLPLGVTGKTYQAFANAFSTAGDVSITLTDMMKRPDLTRRRHVDLARVSSAICRREA